MSSNPFISVTENDSEYLTANCSLNRVRIAKLPIYGIEDDIEGKQMSEIFGAGIIINEIERNAEALGINLSEHKRMDLPILLDEKIDEGNQEAIRIVRKYGNRLGLFLLVLKTGLPENRAAREDWADEHWEYWANIKKIFLAGGLACGRMGEYMLMVVKELFEKANVPMYNIIRNTNSSEMGAKGCLTRLEDDNDVHILFDFGQTKIKRLIAVHRYSDVANNNPDNSYMSDSYDDGDDKRFAGDSFDNEYKLIKLSSKKSINMDLHVEDDEERRRQAEELHSYIVESIVDTYNEALKYGSIRWEIVISIASYVMEGKIYDARSGYAKLCMLSNNYAGYLAATLEKRLNRGIIIKLVHDGTAAALYYKGVKNAVCITAGTALGVGFPEIAL